MFPFVYIAPGLFIPSYYLIMTGVVCVCLWWTQNRAEKLGLAPRMALDLGLTILVTSFIGARLFHVFYESFDFYRDDLVKIFYFWNGGFVFYGGAILGSIGGAVFLYLKARNEMGEYFDLMAPVCSLGYSLGRIACFGAGCCYGRATDVPWAVEGRHPTQLYATFWEALVVCLLLAIEKIPEKNRPSFLRQPGSIFATWMIFHGIGRMIMEYYRDDFRGPHFGFSVSSWISLSIIVLGAAWLWKHSMQATARHFKASSSTAKP